MKYGRTIEKKARRFICPECGEYVAFVYRNKYKSYFRHGDKDLAQTDCDLRTSSSYLSVYEKVGLPIFLKKYRNHFEIWLGLYGLELDLLEEAEKRHSSLHIRCGNKTIANFYIDQQRFQEHKMTDIKLHQVAESYELTIQSDSSEIISRLTDRWGKIISGISNHGALFFCNGQKNRKLIHNCEVTYDTPYLFVSLSNSRLLQFMNVESFKLGMLDVDHSFGRTYHVYQVTFKNLTDYENSELSYYLREIFKISLVNKPTRIFSLWPPSIVDDPFVFYQNEGNTYHLMQSAENDVSLYQHGYQSRTLIQPTPLSSKNNENYLFSFHVTKEDQILTLVKKRKTVGSIYKVMSSIEDDEQSFKFRIIDKNNADVLAGEHKQLPPDKQMKVITNARCELLWMRSGTVHAIINIHDVNGVTIKNLLFGDELFLIYGNKFYPLVRFVYDQSNQNIDDELYPLLKKTSYPYVSVPIFVKDLVAKLPTTSKVRRMLESYLNINQMPYEAIVLLKKNLKR